MTKAKNQSIIAGLAILLLILGIVWWTRKPSQTTNATKQISPSAQTPQTDKPETNTPTGNTVEGILKISDNPKRGNFMLVSEDKTVYIFTSRDYSELADKTVIMSYEGNLDEFRLGDIVAK